MKDLRNAKWLAPEHYRDALGMQRDRNGDLVIEMSDAMRSALWPRPEPRPKPIWYGLGEKAYRRPHTRQDFWK